MLIPIVELMRAESGPDGTFGVLRIQKQIFCSTLEPRWRMNEQNISCIPAGQYLCGRVYSPRFGDTFEISDVHGRTLIRLHPGNWVAQTEGCILLGESVKKLRNNRAVTNSGDTFKAFMVYMSPHEKFHLTIEEYY